MEWFSFSMIHWTYSCGQYDSQFESQWQSLNANLSVIRPIYATIITKYVIFFKIRMWKHKMMDLIADILAFDDCH